jgi:hypothetical protein
MLLHSLLRVRQFFYSNQCNMLLQQGKEIGRTNPSFRVTSVIEKREWKVFRDSLDKSNRKISDEVFSIAHLYNSVSSYTVKPIYILYRHYLLILIIYHMI